ncbi:sigma-54 interaction domain-containing protein [Fervidicella metallireducens]|uniref:sigma-54 interaction domain-containing protein n=1 Tax=Fervidicella metallireducens TaxID=655338 RepID=UPI000B08E93C|nr:sigma 54-interacting transcriptional regulator [Fervidicella metallireducens]
MDFQRELLEILLRYVEEGIHVIDKEGKTLIYNKAMETLEGLEGTEVINRNILDVFPSLNENTSTLYKVIETKEPIIERFQTYVNKKGHSITTVNTTVPIIKNNDVMGAVEISKNFTKVKELYDRIINLTEKTTEVKNESDFNFEGIIGCSPSFIKALDTAKKAAATSSTVLIYGETGTGKEVFAKSIHNESKRKDRPFVAINCAALPDGLLEGILFGTVKGGFTGAVNRPGLFEQANGGTILLDELNSMSLNLQAKLLRVLQEGYIRRIGDVKDIPVDVRIIATTNEEPYRCVAENKIRKDLYYRLSVINLKIPAFTREKRTYRFL